MEGFNAKSLLSEISHAGISADRAWWVVELREGGLEDDIHVDTSAERDCAIIRAKGRKNGRVGYIVHF